MILNEKAYTHMSLRSRQIAHTKDSSIDGNYNATECYKNKLFCVVSRSKRNMQSTQCRLKCFKPLVPCLIGISCPFFPITLKMCRIIPLFGTICQKMLSKWYICDLQSEVLDYNLTINTDIQYHET